MSTPNAGLIVVLGILCGAIIADPAAAQAFNVIKGDQLSLTDRRGQMRANLGLFGGNQEYTYFYLNDSRGKMRVRFMVYPDNRPPTLTFYDSNGKAIPTGTHRPEAPGGVTIADVNSRATGKYNRAGADDLADPGLADSVQQLQIPVNPAGDAKRWLDAHNYGLLGIIKTQFDAQDMRKFTAAESEQCSQNIYCQLAYRQQAISLLVSR